MSRLDKKIFLIYLLTLKKAFNTCEHANLKITNIRKNTEYLMMIWLKVKKIFLKILAVVVIIVLVFSPYLLILDFEKYSPFVVTVWVISVLYYLFVRSKKE